MDSINNRGICSNCSDYCSSCGKFAEKAFFKKCSCCGNKICSRCVREKFENGRRKAFCLKCFKNITGDFNPFQRR
jgi:hypothetical protein